MNTKISIIVPVYNAQDTIAKCIDSILNNSYRAFEIILIDDGSSDGSSKMLQAYAEQYPEKITVIGQENQGVARTRNRGIKEAKSPYVMFVDNDDHVDTDYLDTFAAEIDRNKLDLVIGGYRRTTSESTLYEMKLEDSLWSRYMIMAPWSKIYRREFLLEHGIDFLDNNIGEDVYFNLQAINLTDKIAVIPYTGYNWYFNDKSVSNTHQKTLNSKINVLHLLDACYDKLRKSGVLHRQEVEFYFIRYVIWYLLFIGRNSSPNQTFEEYTKVFSWLHGGFPAYRNNQYISVFAPKGETLKNRLIVNTFMLIHRFNLAKPFFWIYSRG